jgi:protein-disulfide isomerase
MNASKCTLAPLLFVLAACSPACSANEAIAPEGGKANPSDNSGPVQAKPQSPQPPSEMITEAKGVDLTKLTEPQKSSFYQIINTEPSACGKPHSLAVSLRDDDACRDSLSVSQFVADALAQGASPSDIKAALDEVVDSLRVREINIKGSPVYGNERAPVTVVVFADFECPHCAAESPVLRQTVDQYRGRAKLVFKHFPITGHMRAKPAALATMAAHEQGKFWEMSEIVFANQTALEDDDLLAYAKTIGLNIPQFQADLEAGKGKDRVEGDRADGEKLEITGTPAVFVNGRYYNQFLFGGTVAGWIDDALRR